MNPIPTLTEAAAEYRKAHAAYSACVAAARVAHEAWQAAYAEQERLSAELLDAQRMLGRAAEVEG